ncbi:hypothetical protein FQA39_LY11050 [Lamprigera yunnana]|nr:hypothetical protein FQA39_LY11050 [Lamprigera yunnana]
MDLYLYHNNQPSTSASKMKHIESKETQCGSIRTNENESDNKDQIVTSLIDTAVNTGNSSINLEMEDAMQHEDADGDTVQFVDINYILLSYQSYSDNLLQTCTRKLASGKFKMSEKVLDEENWRHEAESVIIDVKNHVKHIELSNLKNTTKNVFLNITTLEDQDYCVELSKDGFRVVGKSFNVDDQNNGEYFETPYSLLSKISINFYRSFGNELMSKLHAVHQMEQQ